MTQDDFDSTKWGCNMHAIYNGTKYEIGACAFDERLVGLVDAVYGSDELTWVRCENIELVK